MSHRPQKTTQTEPAAASIAGLPAALLAHMPTPDRPHVRQTRWDTAEETPVWIDPTQPGRPLTPLCLRDKLGEHGTPEVVRRMAPLSRIAVLAIAAEAEANVWSWILAGQRLRDLYLLDAEADAKAARKSGASR
jgi:hypothetical protein